MNPEAMARMVWMGGGVTSRGVQWGIGQEVTAITQLSPQALGFSSSLDNSSFILPYFSRLNPFCKGSWRIQATLSEI